MYYTRIGRWHKPSLATRTEDRGQIAYLVGTHNLAPLGTPQSIGMQSPSHEDLNHPSSLLTATTHNTQYPPTHPPTPTSSNPHNQPHYSLIPDAPSSHPVRKKILPGPAQPNPAYTYIQQLRPYEYARTESKFPPSTSKFMQPDPSPPKLKKKNIPKPLV